LPPSRLTLFQQEVLKEFFLREDRFFLTGGALAGFHLGHRETLDLDLFTTSATMEDGSRALADVARTLGATVEQLRSAPDFRRALLTRGQDSVLVDLVFERVPQLVLEKTAVGSIRLDPPEEILANKLCTLLSRAELRDLVDVWALEGAGYRIEDALPAASHKDGGLTPAQLAWVLSEVRIGDDAKPPGDVDVETLRAYLADLVSRLAALARP
jgi:hypothetical protein